MYKCFSGETLPRGRCSPAQGNCAAQGNRGFDSNSKKKIHKRLHIFCTSSQLEFMWILWIIKTVRGWCQTETSLPQKFLSGFCFSCGVVVCLSACLCVCVVLWSLGTGLWALHVTSPCFVYVFPAWGLLVFPVISNFWMFAFCSALCISSLYRSQLTFFFFLQFSI